jgi:hypothetical protein
VLRGLQRSKNSRNEIPNISKDFILTYNNHAVSKKLGAHIFGNNFSQHIQILRFAVMYRLNYVVRSRHLLGRLAVGKPMIRVQVRCLSVGDVFGKMDPSVRLLKNML